MPLDGVTHESVHVNAICDHHGSSEYDHDGIIVACTGEQFTAKNGNIFQAGNLPESNLALSVDPTNDNYFKKRVGNAWAFGVVGIQKDKNSSPFSLPFIYTDPDVIWYDGHPGYDFHATNGTPVKSACDGRVITNEFDPCFNTLCIEYTDQNTKERFRIYYLHMDPIDESLMSGGVPIDVSVVKGQRLGLSGHTSCRKGGVAPHLHFQMKWLNPLTKEWELYDPYGYISADKTVLQKPMWL